MGLQIPRVMFIDSQQGPSVEQELEAMLSEPCTLTLASPSRPHGLPERISWVRLSGKSRELVALCQSLRPDYIHAHAGISSWLAAHWAARSIGARFCPDFNDIRILLRGRAAIDAARSNATRFEQPEHWERPLSETERSRIEAVLDLLPSDADSLLDVGCGDGRVTNRLNERVRHVVGLDASEQALSYVDTQTVLSQVDQLPFADRSFHTVACIQVLEHLPGPVLRRTVTELARVAAKYVLVGVPLQEPLHYRAFTSPNCGQDFNQTGHLHRFSLRRLKWLFPGWELARQRSCGAERRPYYNRALMLVRRKLGGGNVRTAHAECPACGTPTWIDKVREQNLITKACDRYNGKIQRRLPGSPSHLVAVFARRC